MDILRKKLPILIALVLAAVSSLGMIHFMKNRESVSVAQVAPTAISTSLPVVVASRELLLGSKIREDDLTVENWPKDIVRDFHIQSKKQLIGRILNTDIMKDEPLIETKLLNVGENISNLIPMDLRGVTVSVRRSEALLNVLQRGSFVDVLSVIDGNEANPERSSKVIAYSAKVLAITDKADNKNANRNMEVILLVKPYDAELIATAMNNGIIELIVRSKSNPILEVF